MKNDRVRKSVVMVFALSGVILNVFYCIGFFQAFFDPQYNFAIREFLVSAIVLEVGWMALLLWTILKPFERRHILLFTIIPIFFGNLLTGINQWMDAPGQFGFFVSNTVFGLLYSALFLFAYILGKPVKDSQQ
jgi:hypothetical protein